MANIDPTISPEEFEALDDATKAEWRANLSELGQAACEYCEMGFAIIPIHPHGKTPAIKAWQDNATTDWNVACYYWTKRPQDNIGIVTGAPSGGLFVIDVDCDESKGGDDNLWDYEKDHGKLPETMCADSGSGRGGKHYYYKASRPIKTQATSLCIDVRGDGGYIIAPPSIHPSGGEYYWDLGPDDDYEPAEADESVFAFLAFLDSLDDGSKDENGRFKLPDVIEKGQRNDLLMRYGFSLRAQGFDDDMLLAELQSVNASRVKPPLPDHEVQAIAKSVCRKKPGYSKELLKRIEAAKKSALKKANAVTRQQRTFSVQKWKERQAAAEAVHAEPNRFDGAPIHPLDFMPNGKFLHNCVAVDMTARFHFAIADGTPTTWTGKTYATGWNPPMQALREYKHGVNERERKEVQSYLQTYAPEVEFADAKFIAFANGNLDVTTGILYPPSPAVRVPNIIPHEYHADARSDVFEKFLDDVSCHRRAVMLNLLEIIGVCMSRDVKLTRKCFFLVNAQGRNGKSTYVNMLRNILGTDNVCTIKPQNLGERFTPHYLMGKLANLADDIPASLVDKKSTSVLKQSVSGDAVEYEIKNGPKGFFRPYATHVFIANTMPRLGDATGGMIDRLHPVEFAAHFEGSSDNTQLGKELATEEVAQAAIAAGIEQLRKIYERGGALTQTQYSDHEKAQIELDNDNALRFLADEGLDADTLDGWPTKAIYARYEAWCESEGIWSAKHSQNGLTRHVCTKLGITNHRMSHRDDNRCTAYCSVRNCNDRRCMTYCKK